MSTHSVRVAKATQEDILGLNKFMKCAEETLEVRAFDRYEPFEKWQQMDDEDPEKQPFLRARKRIADEEGISEKHVDLRLVCYEVLRELYCSGWRRPLMAAELLIEAACDPTESTLTFYPGIECSHVAPEQ